MRLPWGVISILFPFHGVCRTDDPPALSLSRRTALIAYGKRITETLRKGASPQIDVKSMNEVNGSLVSFIQGVLEEYIIRVIASWSGVDNVLVNNVQKLVLVGS